MIIGKRNINNTSIFFLILTLVILILLITIYYQKKFNDENINQFVPIELPKFELTNLEDLQKTISYNDIKNKKVIINFFASWCTPCKEEHHLFFDLKKKFPDLVLIGINHKDKKNDAINYLKEYGNPYSFVGTDFEGKIGYKFGVFGLPETYVTNKSGKIIYKHTGPITKNLLKDKIFPLL